MSDITVSSDNLRRPKSPFDPFAVRYSPRWLAALLGAGALSATLLQRGGPAGATAVGAAMGAGAAGVGYAMWVEPRTPRLEHIHLRFANLPPALEGLRIGLLGDMHLGQRYTEENTRWAVDQMVAERPDLIAITGDFVSFTSAIADLPDLLRPLHAPLGCYAVTGNHDYWEGVAAIRAAIEPLGIEFLLNRGKRLSVGNADLYVAGVDDMWEGSADLGAALAARRSDDFTLLLAHAPDIADLAAQRGVNLQVSGHTHGGHLRLPLLGAFALPFYGLRYDIGHIPVGDMQLYITRGLGGRPLRLMCPPEVTILTLHRG